MKKIGLITGALLLVTILGMNVAALNTREQGTTNEEKAISKSLNDTTVLKSANAMDYLTESGIQDTLPVQLGNGETNSSLVIESNGKVKTTKAKKKNKKKNKKKKKKAESNLKYVGSFKVTGYCSCSSCCGKSNGVTSSGTRATEGRTIAADTSRFPFGTKMVIDGHTYTVEDRGGAINGNKIDVYFSSHSMALQWGVRYCDVYVEK